MADIDILRSTALGTTNTIVAFEKTPFWPVTFSVGDEHKVRFNPGYLIDYQAQSGSKVTKFQQVTLRPTNMDKVFNLKDGGKFYLEVSTSGNSATPVSLEIMQIDDEPPEEVDNWHFGSLNVEEVGYISDNSFFRIPMASFNKETGEIKEVCLRENLHYQKVHHQNMGGGDARIIKSIGETNEIYGANPPVQVRCLRGIWPIIVTEGDDIIDISIDQSGSPDDDTTDPPTPTPKSAIVPYEDTHIAFWCAEAPDPYFYDVISVELDGKTCVHELDDKLIQSCEPDSLKITACFADNSTAKIKARLSGNLLIVQNKSWFASARVVNVTVAGIQKGLGDHRYKEYTEEQYNANARFYGWAHDPSFRPLSAAPSKNEDSVEPMDV